MRCLLMLAVRVALGVLVEVANSQVNGTKPHHYVGSESCRGCHVKEYEGSPFVYGIRWKQRYFTKRGDNYYVEPAHGTLPRRSGSPTTPKREQIGGAFLRRKQFRAIYWPHYCDGCHS